MGYTHYWEDSCGFTTEQWKAFTAKVKEIFKNAPVPLANGLAERGTKPIVNSKYVSFNGVEDDGHETCYVEKKGTEFSFTKTAHKPYDEVVVEVLKAARAANPNVKLSSDGGSEVFRVKTSGL